MWITKQVVAKLMTEYGGKLDRCHCMTEVESRPAKNSCCSMPCESGQKKTLENLAPEVKCIGWKLEIGRCPYVRETSEVSGHASKGYQAPSEQGDPKASKGEPPPRQPKGDKLACEQLGGEAMKFTVSPER